MTRHLLALLLIVALVALAASSLPAGVYAVDAPQYMPPCPPYGHVRADGTWYTLSCPVFLPAVEVQP